MSKSLRLHVFFHILIAAIAIVFANRLIGQYMLSEQLTERLKREMALAVFRCANDLEDHSRYTLCASSLDRGSLTASMADYHGLCPPSLATAGPEIIDICRQFRTDTAYWTEVEVESKQGAFLSEKMIGSERWYAARSSYDSDAAMIVMKRSDILGFYQQIWSLRDRNLVYVAPFVLLTLILVALHVTAVVMRPIKQMQASMSSLDPDNIGKSALQPARFVEFKPFIAIFDELRTRLSSSFDRTRRFAGNAAHQLRTPLTILRGNAEQLIQDMPDGSPSQIRARIMSDEIDRLNDTVEKLLLLSQADSGSLTPQLEAVDLSQTLSELIEGWDSFNSGLQIQAFIEPGIHWRCDKVLLYQLLLNLYDNAVKYNTPAGWVEVALSRQANQFRLTVTNPTAGLSDDLLNNAFERFYRGKLPGGRPVGGHGLGLSICLEIARVHQAVLSVRSGSGNVFVASLAGPLDPVLSPS